MALDTYAGLLSGVADWLMRDDLTSVIPSFVALAESDMNRVLRLRAMLSRATLVGDDEYVALPADCLEVRSLALDGLTLEYAGSGPLDAYAAGYAGGQSSWWGIDGTDLRFAPAPTGSPSISLSYYARIPALSDDNQTNAVLTEHPGIYLYGALLAAAPYLLDDQRGMMWRAMYDDAVSKAQVSDEHAQWPGPLVIRPVEA